MRHKVDRYKLGRSVAGRRKTLFRNLVTSVIDQERVITTVRRRRRARRWSRT